MSQTKMRHKKQPQSFDFLFKERDMLKQDYNNYVNTVEMHINPKKTNELIHKHYMELADKINQIDSKINKLLAPTRHQKMDVTHIDFELGTMTIAQDTFMPYSPNPFVQDAWKVDFKH